ncbi:SDR family NAD(P)-dependent oxidoreductase [Nonomuraea antimicrobica]
MHARVIELNLTAPLLVSQRAYPLLAASGGAVIMIGSASGARPSPGTSAYGAAKAGLHHLARCLAAEWAPRVRVNTVVVGLATTLDTPAFDNPAFDTPAVDTPAPGTSGPGASGYGTPAREASARDASGHYGGAPIWTGGPSRRAGWPPLPTWRGRACGWPRPAM